VNVPDYDLLKKVFSKQAKSQIANKSFP